MGGGDIREDGSVSSLIIVSPCAHHSKLQGVTVEVGGNEVWSSC